MNLTTIWQTAFVAFQRNQYGYWTTHEELNLFIYFTPDFLGRDPGWNDIWTYHLKLEKVKLTFNPFTLAKHQKRHFATKMPIRTINVLASG